MKKFHIFRSREKVVDFLDMFKFVYEIPCLKKGYYYLVRLSENGEVVEYATQRPYIEYKYNMGGIPFYDKYRMTEVIFGVRKERFKIDSKRMRKFKKETKKKKWNGEEFVDYLKRNDVGMFDSVSLGVGRMSISIQGGKYVKSEPNEILTPDQYRSFELAFFNGVNMIFDKENIGELIVDFKKKTVLESFYCSDGTFGYVPPELIYELLSYFKNLRENRKQIKKLKV